MGYILALFDFDGTITEKDSFVEFIKYSKGQISFYSGLIILSPILLFHKVGIIRNWRAKELVFSYFFKNENYEIFRRICREFSLKYIPEIVKPQAFDLITNHITKGDRVIIITATFEDFLLEWCTSMNIELLGTRILVKDGKITGKIKGKNCYGEEKVVRLKEYLDLRNYNKIYAYGDSKGDIPLMEVADRSFYRFL